MFPMKRTTTRPHMLRVRLSEIEKAQLDHLAGVEGKTASDIMRWLLSARYREATMEKTEDGVR